MTHPLDERVLTVVGTYETHDKPTIGEGPTAKPNPHYQQPYNTLSLYDVMAYQRTSVAKDKAQWVLCSTYAQADGRKHKVQEAAGRFVMLAVDMDTGNVPGKELLAAVQSFTGPCIIRIYSSSSATKQNRKWRVLVPLAQAEPFKTWLALQVALNEHIAKATGHRPDRALERAGQPIYLPNTAPRSDITPLIEDKLIDGTPFDWRSSDTANDAVIAVLAQQEEQEAEQQRRAAEARKKLSHHKGSNIDRSERSVIDAFNAANDLANVLRACGYEEGPRNGWRSPNQSSGSHATKIFDEPAGQYWTSLSMSDFEANVGRHTADGRACFGDAFDVWCYKFHGNNRDEAIKAAADELGIKPPPSAAQLLADRVRANQTRINQAPPADHIRDATKMVSDDHVVDANKTMPATPTVALAHNVTASAIQQALQILLQEDDSPTTLASAAVIKEQQTFPPLGDESLGKLLSYVQASHLPAWEPPQELIEGMLIEGGMTVIYGDSNTGKSFLTLDMAAHVSLGLPWFGRRVRQGAVVYLAAESPRSIVDRARALADHLKQPLDSLFIVNCPIDLFDDNGDTTAVVDTIKAIEQRFNVKVCMAVADTLARVIGAGDENKASDMGVLVQHIDLIRAALGIQFIVIHHTGKDAAKGARGSSALRAATDTEIEVSDKGQGPKEFKVTKQRDLPGKNEVLAFELVTVNLGIGVFDNIITTCVVLRAEPAADDPMSDLKEGELEILDLIKASPTGGLRYREVLEQVQTVSEPTAKRYLSSLRKQGLIYHQSGQVRLGSGKVLANGMVPGREF
jgi:uncharacterized membrane protein